MLLVRTGIANLLSLPSLERDGFIVSYNTMVSWMVQCPVDTILKFHKDTCTGFPYINLENLEANVMKSPGGDVLSKVKAMQEAPSKRHMPSYRL